MDEQTTPEQDRLADIKQHPIRDDEQCMRAWTGRCGSDRDWLIAEVDRLRSGIQAMIESLVGAPCCFWACPGPDEPITPMATCNVCATVIAMRELVAGPAGGAR